MRLLSESRSFGGAHDMMVDAVFELLHSPAFTEPAPGRPLPIVFSQVFFFFS
jgi:hypothetical protein